MVTRHFAGEIRSLPMASVVIDDFGTEIHLLPLDAPRWLLNWSTIFAALDFLDSGDAH